MKTFIFFSFLLSLQLLAHADGKVRIGCAYTCDSYTHRSLMQSGKALAAAVELVDLSIEKKVNWSELDGIVIPGGADIDPKFYLQHVEPDLQARIRSLDHLVEYTDEGKARDEFEYGLLREYYADSSLKAFPVLGICRGMQIMTVALGIPLYVDIKTELGIDNRIDLYDEVHIAELDSVLGRLFPQIFNAYKSHHQGLRVPYFQEHQERWPNVRVTAYSNEGRIAEGLELLDRPALGVQFHPEADNNSVRKIVFDWFVKKSLDRAKMHQ